MYGTTNFRVTHGDARRVFSPENDGLVPEIRTFAIRNTSALALQNSGDPWEIIVGSRDIRDRIFELFSAYHFISVDYTKWGVCWLQPPEMVGALLGSSFSTATMGPTSAGVDVHALCSRIFDAVKLEMWFHDMLFFSPLVTLFS